MPTTTRRPSLVTEDVVGTAGAERNFFLKNLTGLRVDDVEAAFSDSLLNVERALPIGRKSLRP